MLVVVGVSLCVVATHEVMTGLMWVVTTEVILEGRVLTVSRSNVDVCVVADVDSTALSVSRETLVVPVMGWMVEGLAV